MVRIPQEYQEVEYLESTGTQYIITNYHPQTDWTAVDWKFAFTASQNGDQMLWGARSATNGKKVWQCEKYSGRNWYVACGSVSYRAVLGSYGGKLNQIYTGHVDNTTFTVGGGSASPNQTNTGENESAIGIFCWNKDGTAEHKNGGLRIYSLTFKENDIVSANFIPCYRKSDNEAGMYDTVSGTFYTNSGTGTFLVGNPVDYSTISLLEARRRILLNTPHLESISGATASFETDMASNLKECKVYFTPIQEGSGDPSPDNVRPIHGCDGVTVYHNNNSLTIPFPQTIYGGYVDLVKGEVVEEWAKWVEDGSRTPSYWVWQKDDTNTVYTALMPELPVGSRHNPNFGFIEKVMCPNRHYVSITSSGVRTSNIISLYRAQNGASFAYSFTGEEFASMSKAELKAYIAENPIEAVYILLTPRVYPLDPVTIRTLKGLNNIWSSANGNIEISYWTH